MQLVLYGVVSVTLVLLCSYYCMVLYRLLWCCYAVSTVWVVCYSGVAMQLVLYGVVSVTLVLLCS